MMDYEKAYKQFGFKKTYTDKNYSPEKFAKRIRKSRPRSSDISYSSYTRNDTAEEGTIALKIE